MRKGRNINKAFVYLGLAIGCAFVAFYALFAGGINHVAATGVMLLGFLGFWVLFNRAFDLWSERRKQERQGES